MRIAVLHYHLRGGGVTRVVDTAFSALKAHDIRGCVLVGEEPAAPLASGVPVATVEGLGYHTGTQLHDPDTVVAELRSQAERLLGGPPDCWHIHNHHLGKNTLTPLVVQRLIEAGESVLLQPHDFPEDGRPANYDQLLAGLRRRSAAELARDIYPVADHVHYCPINDRDAGFLQRAGIPSRCIHALPNAVDLPPSDQAQVDPSQPPLILYPTRAIRRKNLGELLLWASVLGGSYRFATSLIPQNPEARDIHDGWVALAKRLRLPITFGIGETWTGSFTDLLQSATAIITTSVAEGFGLAFLEPWLAQRPVCGRLLPEICGDFSSAGIALDDCYEHIGVPLSWIDHDALRDRLHKALARSYSAYGRQLTEREHTMAWEALLCPAPNPDQVAVDFGRLDETAQEEVLLHLHRHPNDAEQMRPNVLEMTGPTGVQTNAAHIAGQYSAHAYGERLAAVYRSVLQTSRGAISYADGESMLASYLAPQRFNLLRT